jgi:hypothetical protein
LGDELDFDVQLVDQIDFGMSGRKDSELAGKEGKREYEHATSNLIEACTVPHIVGQRGKKVFWGDIQRIRFRGYEERMKEAKQRVVLGY